MPRKKLTKPSAPSETITEPTSPEPTSLETAAPLTEKKNPSRKPKGLAAPKQPIVTEPIVTVSESGQASTTKKASRKKSVAAIAPQVTETELVSEEVPVDLSLASEASEQVIDEPVIAPASAVAIEPTTVESTPWEPAPVEQPVTEEKTSSKGRRSKGRKAEVLAPSLPAETEVSSAIEAPLAESVETPVAESVAEAALEIPDEVAVATTENRPTGKKSTGKNSAGKNSAGKNSVEKISAGKKSATKEPESKKAEPPKTVAKKAKSKPVQEVALAVVSVEEVPPATVSTDEFDSEFVSDFNRQFDTEPPVVVEMRRPKGSRSKPPLEPISESAVDSSSPLETGVEELERPAGFDFASFDLPIPVWRQRTNGTPRSAEAQVTDPEVDEASSDSEDDRDSGDPRKRRRRKRGRNGFVNEPKGSDSTVAQVISPASPPQAVKEAAPTEPVPIAIETLTLPTPPTMPPVMKPTVPPMVRRDRPVVQVPVKASIPIPDDAPQIVVRGGVPTLVRDHRVYPPIMFFGSPADERRAETVLEQVKMAAEAGVHLHSYLIDFDVDLNRVDGAAQFAAYVLSRSVQVDPESQVIFRLVIQAPRNWQEKYPNAVYKNEDGSLAEPSVCDDDYWTAANTCVERFVKKMRLVQLNEHILGIHLERGEWFFAEGAGYDDSKSAQVKFRDWARTRYLNDEVTLRASWFDGAVKFESLQIPEYQPQGQEGERFIRSSRRQRRYVDYHLFLSDATVHRVAELAYTAKSASEGYFLIGASYGYTFEWSHPASGHLSLGKLLRTPEIDFIAGPPSYRTRQPGGSAPFPGPIDSFALNGKLYISEEDFKTSLSIGHEPDDFNPQLKTPQALESVHWRGAGAALAHASGVAWMDLWGNGWLRTHSVWERAKKVREAMIDRLAVPLTDPEVAIFIDERALAYLVDSNAFKLLVQNVRESVLRAGVSAAFYLLSDLAHREKFPESKLYIFVNAWDVRPEHRTAIKTRLQRDNKVLFWLYAAGLFDAGRDSLERAREVTGIALKPQPFNSRAGTTILNRRHPLSEAFPDRSVVGGSKLEPSYFAIPEGATVLGEYSQTGLPSFVVKEFKEGPADTHWTSVFLGEPHVNPALIRALAQMAGAHVWNFHEDVVHVRQPFCTIHCKGAGPRTVTLPGKYSAYNLLNDEWSAVDSPNLRFTAVDGSTYCFLVGPRDELETQLQADPKATLHIENLPPRDANVRVDGSNFDVPIMKLDEWMGGSDSDDNADEWFLRPQQIDEEPLAPAEESAERVGRRRRRRRDGRGGGMEEEFTTRSNTPGAPATDYDDVGLNVMFRKRD